MNAHKHTHTHTHVCACVPMPMHTQDCKRENNCNWILYVHRGNNWHTLWGLWVKFSHPAGSFWQQVLQTDETSVFDAGHSRLLADPVFLRCTWSIIPAIISEFCTVFSCIVRLSFVPIFHETAKPIEDWIRMAPTAHIFECLVSNRWNCRARIRCGHVGGGSVIGGGLCGFKSSQHS